MTLLSLGPRACVQIGRAIVEHLIFRPIRGLREIIDGIEQAAPDLFRAASQASVDAIECRLSETARRNVRQGIDRVVAGAMLLVPFAAILGFWACFHPGITWLRWVGWLVVIA